MLSVFDLFRVGIGPSSSHTVGPMRAAYVCVVDLVASGRAEEAARISVDLFGSLAATGRGHGTDNAVLFGLSGFAPELITAADMDACEQALREGTLLLGGSRPVAIQMSRDIRFVDETLPFHPNALRIRILDRAGDDLLDRIYYSVGGGFIVPDEGNAEKDAACGVVVATHAADGAPQREAPYPFVSSRALLAWCARTGLSVAGVMAANEKAIADVDLIDDLWHIWEVMDGSIEAGLHAEGVLPGALALPRRAPHLYARLVENPADDDPARVMDWLDAYAIAVAEENAAGHRVVTAPTNGAAAVIPAVIRYHLDTHPGPPKTVRAWVADFLLTAGAVGILIKTNASIAGAEVGCQGEIGSACSMAAAGLAQILGGTPQQVENAAEIAMEHNLGLTCDPVGGLVQIPCIERNAIAAVTALSAARMALAGDGRHMVSLDAVIETMRQTGIDMNVKYKETSRGGLAVNQIEC